MNSEEDVERLEKLIGQLNGLHSEISTLARKSPNDGLNIFKLKLVNKVLASGNTILTREYRPFDDFEEFSQDELPTNSDVTMILAQYMEQAERLRSDNVTNHFGAWKYVINGATSNIDARMPTRVGTGTK